MVTPPRKWNNPDAGIVMHAIESLRRLVILVGFGIGLSLILNGARTLAVVNQVNKLEAENRRLIKKEFCTWHATHAK